MASTTTQAVVHQSNDHSSSSDAESDSSISQLSLRALEQRIIKANRTINMLQQINNSKQTKIEALQSVLSSKAASPNQFALLTSDDIEEMDTHTIDNHTQAPPTRSNNHTSTSAPSISAKRPSPSSPVPHNVKRPNTEASKIKFTSTNKSSINHTTRNTTSPPNNASRTKAASSQHAEPQYANTQAAAKVNKKPPPIVVSNLDLKATSAILSTKIGKDNFSFRGVSGVNTQIVTKNLADFKTVRALLQNSEAQYHSYTPKEEQHINIVLRHLHSTFDDSDIKQAINELNIGIVIEKVMRLPTKSENILWLIQLKAGSDAKQLLDQRVLLHQRVVFERKRQSGIAQCKNCQLFGHSARNCNRPFRCVKCTESHNPGECPRTLDPALAEETLPNCVNCNGDHPANFRGCPYYAKVLQRKQVAAHPHVQVQTPHNNTAAVRKGISFADATRSDNALPTNIFGFINDECQKYFDLDFTELRKTMVEFLPTYTKLSADKRPLALLNLAMQISK